MKKLFSFFIAALLAAASVLPVFAADDQPNMENLMLGGYGWTTNSGWGNANRAVDGKLAQGNTTDDKRTVWSPGARQGGNAHTAGFRVGAMQKVKYNKVVLKFYYNTLPYLEGFSLKSYDTMSEVPSNPGDYMTFKPGTDEKTIFDFNVHQDPASWPDQESGEFTFCMPETEYREFFGLTLDPTPNNAPLYTPEPVTLDKAPCLSEFELYYATPHTAEFADSDVRLYVPDAGEERFHMPEIYVYDEVGDRILAAFEHSVELAEDYTDVRLENGEIVIGSNCTADSVGLACKWWDDEGVLLEQTLAIPVREPGPEYDELKEVAKQLETVIPKQVDQSIELPVDVDGTAISWSVSPEGYIDTDGTLLKRPAYEEEDKLITLTAKLSKGGYSLTSIFEVTVLKNTVPDMVNFMEGGYGWVVNSGWGVPSNAVDGDLSTSWTMNGNHNGGSATAGFRVAGEEAVTFNKVVLRFAVSNLENMEAFKLDSYETMSNDPGRGNYAAFVPGTGMHAIVASNPDDPALWPDENGVVTVSLKESVTAQYFGLLLDNVAGGSSGTWISEMEVYYAAPNRAELVDPDMKFYIPTRPETAEFDIPEVIVYDQMGDPLAAEFPSSFSLAENYPGITLQDGKIKIGMGCNLDSIDIIYRSWDDTFDWLEQTFTIPLEPYSEEYYDVLDAGEYIDTIVPAMTDQNLSLPTSYKGADILWESDANDVLSSDGTVNRPVFDDGDKTVTLTATVSKGKYTITKTYSVVVIKQMTFEQLVEEDANSLSLDISGTVSSDIALPILGYYGSTVSWHSNNPEFLEVENDVAVYHLRKADGSKKVVKLTATVSYEDASVSKQFEIYVKTIPENTSSGGGSGSGGGRPSGGGGSSISTGSGSSSQSNPILSDVLNPLPPEEAGTGKFTDVADDHWAKDYIETLSELRIVNGVDENRFEPSRNVTREEFLKMILTAFDITLKPGDTAFEDVPSDAWYADYVVTAVKEGIVNGVSDREFGVGQYITREDMAVITARILERRGTEFNGEQKIFGDSSDIAEYAADSVDKLARLDILSGNDEGLFVPKGYATRAEAAKVVLVAMEKGGVM